MRPMNVLLALLAAGAANVATVVNGELYYTSLFYCKLLSCIFVVSGRSFDRILCSMRCVPVSVLTCGIQVSTLSVDGVLWLPCKMGRGYMKGAETCKC